MSHYPQPWLHIRGALKELGTEGGRKGGRTEGRRAELSSWAADFLGSRLGQCIWQFS